MNYLAGTLARSAWLLTAMRLKMSSARWFSSFSNWFIFAFIFLGAILGFSLSLPLFVSKDRIPVTCKFCVILVGVYKGRSGRFIDVPNVYLIVVLVIFSYFVSLIFLCSFGEILKYNKLHFQRRVPCLLCLFIAIIIFFIISYLLVLFILCIIVF